MGDLYANHFLNLRRWGYGGLLLLPVAIGIGNLCVTDADGDGVEGASTQIMCLKTLVWDWINGFEQPKSSSREVPGGLNRALYIG